MTTPAVEITNLTKRFGSLTAVDSPVFAARAEAIRIATDNGWL